MLLRVEISVLMRKAERINQTIMYCLRGKKSLEQQFPHHNMVLMVLFQLLLTSAYSMIVPSIYKFITTPTTEPHELACSKSGKFWPGLGGSDSDYGWVLVAYSLMGTLTAPLVGVLLHRLPFTVTIITFLTLFIIGGVIYAMAESVWAAFLGYGICGAGGAFCSITIHTYVGEMGDVMDEIRRKRGKKPRKFLLYNIYSFILTAAFVVPFGTNSVIAQFDISPYHWPGWATAALSAAVGTLTLLLFVETRSLPKLRTLCPSPASLRLDIGLRSWGKCNNCASYLFLVGCGVLSGMSYSVFYGFITPVLSDQFGFDVKYTSYFYLAISTAYIGSSVVQFGAKIAGIGNRIILALSITVALFGALLFGDWQSIGHDPCTSFSLNVTTPDCEEFSYSGAGSGIGGGGVGDSAANTTTVLQELVEGCESLSEQGHTCFWNRQSRITQEYCYECFGTCLSTERSQNIYQLTLAVILLSLATPIGYVFVSAIASDITPLNSQGKVVSIMLGVGYFTRTVTPLWFIKSYEATGRHTYCAMAVMAGSAAVLLLSLLALYKNLAPIPKSGAMVVSATGKLSFEVKETSSVSDEDDSQEIESTGPILTDDL